jgi:hypothetical protein
MSELIRDEEIHAAAEWLVACFRYIERYPQPASVKRHIEEIRRQVEILASKIPQQ